MKRFLNLAFRAIFVFIFIFFKISAKVPRITVVMVIDQFAQHYMDRLGDKFNYAFKMLRKKGINYTNAYHPHGTPTTATGHNAFNTGTLAYKHGIVLNGWGKSNGKNIRYDEDDRPGSLTFGSNGIQKYGNSAKNIMVKGFTDQFVNKSKNNKSFSLSDKSRAAIGMSGKGGQPIWFDANSGIFTTSKAFFKQMPKWLLDFNKKNNVKKMIQGREWKLFYPKNSKYYKLEDINFHQNTNNKYARYDESLIANNAIYTTTRHINKKAKKSYKNDKGYDGFLKSPFANKVLLDLAQDCVENNLKKKDNMLLWVSLSPLDKLGHVYGPQSIEVIDMIYHLDKQINDFYNFLKRKVGEENLLFILTADHGVAPLVELMQEKGFDAVRISPNKLIDEMNQFVKNKYKIQNLVKEFRTSQFYLDRNKLNSLTDDTKLKIMNDLKNIILSKKGIRKAWTYDELLNLDSKFNSFESFYKKQLYPGRSGDLICMPKKYSTITKYLHGSGHRSAYDYNTRVPLIIYQKDRFENKRIDKKVWIPQLPVTLAKILEVEKPTASEFEPLF